MSYIDTCAYLWMYTQTNPAIGDPAGSGHFPELICLDSVSITITYNFNLFTFTTVLDKCTYSQRLSLEYNC